MKLNILLFVIGLLLIIAGVLVKVFKLDYDPNYFIIAGMAVELIAIYLIMKTFTDVKK